MAGFRITTTAGEAELRLEVRYPEFADLDSKEAGKQLMNLVAECLLEFERREP